MAKHLFDVKCFDLAEHFLPEAGEALKDALAREFQQLADDFCAEVEAHQRKQAEAA